MLQPSPPGQEKDVICDHTERLLSLLGYTQSWQHLNLRYQFWASHASPMAKIMMKEGKWMM